MASKTSGTSRHQSLTLLKRLPPNENSLESVVTRSDFINHLCGTSADLDFLATSIKNHFSPSFLTNSSLCFIIVNRVSGNYYCLWSSSSKSLEIHAGSFFVFAINGCSFMPRVQGLRSYTSPTNPNSQVLLLYTTVPTTSNPSEMTYIKPHFHSGAHRNLTHWVSLREPLFALLRHCSSISSTT